MGLKIVPVYSDVQIIFTDVKMFQFNSSCPTLTRKETSGKKLSRGREHVFSFALEVITYTAFQSIENLGDVTRIPSVC